MILVDTGAGLALADRGDAYHARCHEFLRRNREPLMTTYPVLVECVHLMFSRIGVAKTIGWVETLGTHGVGVFSMGAVHLPRLTADPFADARLLSQMRRLLSLDETRHSPLLKGPYVSLSRPFRQGAAVDELVR
jgi:predicted nucleic acid-binding protein